MGVLALLLILGRSLHAWLFSGPGWHRKISALAPVVPPSMLGGFVGLFALIAWKEVLDYDVVVDKARDQLHEIVTNLVPHAFAALTLGFAAGSALGGSSSATSSYNNNLASSQNSDVFASWHKTVSVLWHEGIPMLLYDQVVVVKLLPPFEIHLLPTR